MRFSLSPRLIMGFFLLAAGAGMTRGATVEELQPRAVAILKASCALCHDGTARKRDKGDFDHVLNVQRMIEGEYFLVPGDPMLSEVYAVMIDDDPDLRMPPPDNTEVHQPTDKDIQVIHDWIIAMGVAEAVKDAAETSGADTTKEDREEALAAVLSDAGDGVLPELVEDGAEEATNQKAGEPVAAPDGAVLIEESSGGALTTLLGRMHPLFVHFPVAMLPMAGFIGLTGLILKRYRLWLPAIRWSLWLTAILAPVSVASGWIQSDLEGYRDATVLFHRWSAVVLTVFAWLSVIIVEIAERKATLRWRQCAVAFLLIVALLATLAGHSGGELVYGEGYLFGDR